MTFVKILLIQYLGTNIRQFIYLSIFQGTHSIWIINKLSKQKRAETFFLSTYLLTAKSQTNACNVDMSKQKCSLLFCISVYQDLLTAWARQQFKKFGQKSVTSIQDKAKWWCFIIYLLKKKSYVSCWNDSNFPAD